MTGPSDWAATPYRGRPRFEGANISTFIGFKQFMNLAEDAVLEHFRVNGAGPQKLFADHGIGMEIVDTSVRLTATLHADDEVTGQVTALPAKPGQPLGFSVKMSAVRPEGPVAVLNGKLRVALIDEKEAGGTEPLAGDLRPAVYPDVAAAAGEGPAPVPAPDGPAAALAGPGTNGFLWSWTVPYFFCHYYTRLQSSGYVKLLEEVVDRYLDHAGLPITGLLAQRDWIPVVSRARVQLHTDAFMGETLHTTFTVDDVIKDTVFTATVHFHVLRDGQLVRTATATIMHGYVLARGPVAFADLVVLDDATQRMLLEGPQ